MNAVVLSSGGIDSTTCLALAVDKYGAENVVSLALVYGQKHKKEVECAKSLSEHYGTDFVLIDVEEIFEGSACSLITGDGIPMESYEDQLKKTEGAPVSTYVPFRNGLFLSIAASIAISKGCNEIYCGIHMDDAAGNAYPDCSKLFYENMNGAICEGTGGKVSVVAPFVGKTKADVVAEGLRLNVPYELTWSCYNGGDKPCGKCGTCRDRQKAFELNGTVDPLLEA